MNFLIPDKMPDKKLTDANILNKLEHYKDVEDTDITTTHFETIMLKEIYLLINRLQTENEKLQKEMEGWRDTAYHEASQCETAKAEAYKEFEERLKYKLPKWLHPHIDTIKKEMVGEE